jgi:hypothetical protein
VGLTATAFEERQMTEKKPTRKSSSPIYVRVLPEEKEAIDRKADQAGLHTSVFMRRIGLGYEVRSVVDYERVSDLAKINADLGRLGGLLKLWLTNDKRLAGYSQEELRRMLLKALQGIESTQEEMRAVMKTVVTS